MTIQTVWTAYDGQAWIGFDVVADEAIAVVFENASAHSWRFDYIWHNQPQTFDLNSGTAETSIGIPVGQRKWIPVLWDGEEGFDTELDTFSVTGID